LSPDHYIVVVIGMAIVHHGCKLPIAAVNGKNRLNLKDQAASAK
jgi:hypothetical protein